MAGALTKRPTKLSVPLAPFPLASEAGKRFIEFFTANIRNPNTRRANAGMKALPARPSSKISIGSARPLAR